MRVCASRSPAAARQMSVPFPGKEDDPAQSLFLPLSLGNQTPGASWRNTGRATCLKFAHNYVSGLQQELEAVTDAVGLLEEALLYCEEGFKAQQENLACKYRMARDTIRVSQAKSLRTAPCGVFSPSRCLNSIPESSSFEGGADSRCAEEVQCLAAEVVEKRLALAAQWKRFVASTREAPCSIATPPPFPVCEAPTPLSTQLRSEQKAQRPRASEPKFVVPQRLGQAAWNTETRISQCSLSVTQNQILPWPGVAQEPVHSSPTLVRVPQRGELPVVGRRSVSPTSPASRTSGAASPRVRILPKSALGSTDPQRHPWHGRRVRQWLSARTWSWPVVMARGHGDACGVSCHQFLRLLSCHVMFRVLMRCDGT